MSIEPDQKNGMIEDARFLSGRIQRVVTKT
jgi:hypothetical protein